MSSFENEYATARRLAGAVTRDQSRRLWDLVSTLRPGQRVVVIGPLAEAPAHLLVSAAPAGVAVFTVDSSDTGSPAVSGAGESVSQNDTDGQPRAPSAAGHGEDGRTARREPPEHAARQDVPGPVDVLYLVGTPRFVPATADIRYWSDLVADGGGLLVQEAFSALGVTLALTATTFFSRRWTFAGRSQSMAEYRKGTNTVGARVRSLGAQALATSDFVRAVAATALLVLKLKRVARALVARGQEGA